MIEKIELKRHKLRGYSKSEDQLNPGACSSYPYTPKNSFVESSMDTLYEQQRQNTGGVLHEIDSEVLMRKLMEKKRDNLNSSRNNSNTSSKSQSMTKLNLAEDFQASGDVLSQLSPTVQQSEQVLEIEGEPK